MTAPTTANAFTLTVKSNTGITVDTVTTSDWLTVTKTDEIANNGTFTATLTVGIVEGTDLTNAISDGKIVLKNTLEGGDDLTIDVVTELTPTI